MAMAAPVAQAFPGFPTPWRGFNRIASMLEPWPAACEADVHPSPRATRSASHLSSSRSCMPETRRTRRQDKMGRMILKLVTLPGVAVHYSLGTLVVVTHLVTVAIQDARHDLRV
jgi:hypothetical protein